MHYGNIEEARQVLGETSKPKHPSFEVHDRQLDTNKKVQLASQFEIRQGRARSSFEALPIPDLCSCCLHRYFIES